MNNYFKVLRPGINSTFQDLGRFGLQHLGIVASGCMDQLSFCISNKLVGNKISEGALEFAYQGPLIELMGETVLVAISGKVNFNIIKKNGEIIKGKPNQSFLISNGEKIDILSTINSVYGYFSIFGGFKIEEVKGSVSTLVKAKIGPNNGDKLKVGDKIFFNKSHQADKTKKIHSDFDKDNIIRVMEGLQIHYSQKKAKKIFFQRNTKLQN